MKKTRQRAILTLVATRPVHSQDELGHLLEQQGFEATQATISRDIKEIGLVKMPVPVSEGNPQFKYVLPPPQASFANRLHRLVAELVTSVRTSVNLIVLQTHPGSAMMVATAIDEAQWPEVVGTVGGDDTIIVVVDDPKHTAIVAQRFIDLQENT